MFFIKKVFIKKRMNWHELTNLQELERIREEDNGILRQNIFAFKIQNTELRLSN